MKIIHDKTIFDATVHEVMCKGRIVTFIKWDSSPGANAEMWNNCYAKLFLVLSITPKEKAMLKRFCLHYDPTVRV